MWVRREEAREREGRERERAINQTGSSTHSWRDHVSFIPQSFVGCYTRESSGDTVAQPQ